MTSNPANPSNRRVSLTRRVMFSSGHRYWDPTLTEEANKALFGSWASPYNHGHNYLLDVTVSGLVEPKTGMVVNIKTIDDIVREKIVSQLDQKSLNDEVNFFASRASSVENILEFVRDSISPPNALPEGTDLVALRLEETP